jgi:hypothetical protein
LKTCLGVEQGCEMQTNAVDWGEFTNLWSNPEANTFLGQGASESLPKRGRLKQLLVKTEQILFRLAGANVINYREAAAAVKANTRCPACQANARAAAEPKPGGRCCGG